MKRNRIKKIITHATVSILLIGSAMQVSPGTSFAATDSEVSTDKPSDRLESISEVEMTESSDAVQMGGSESSLLSSDNDSSISTEEETQELASIETEQTKQEKTLAETINTESGKKTDKTKPEEQEFEAPVITENNQHVLGNTMKNDVSVRLNWNASVLPRADFIDISSHQGTMTVADFNNLKKSGVTGVIVKLTEATSYRNPFAGSQIANAKKAGMKVSVYHYSWFSNKQTAEAEADYFIKFAKELGLGSDTIMINDIEQSDIKWLGATTNSVYFANHLISKKATKTVLHYSSLSWFSDGTLNEKELGGPQSVWMAQYLFNPNKNNLQHTDKAAWQWASDLRFPGDSRQFDVNIDYSGRLSKKISGPGPYINHKKYVEIKKKNYSIWSNFNWEKQSSSDKFLNQVLLAKVKYNHSNGETYYSLYDQNDEWLGYINSEATVPAADQGSYISYGKYVTIQSKDYSIWSNFNWKKKSTSASKYKQTFLAKGMYKHAKGTTYYSLYDTKGNWYGYINSEAIEVTDEQGKPVTHNQYVKIAKKNYSIWSDFSWTFKMSSNSLYNKTYKSKVKYNHASGFVYYSLYDQNDEWLGYINSEATVPVADQGPYISYGKYVTIQSKDYSIWSNFDWKKKSTSASKYKQTFLAKGMYKHVKGATYYSLYDTKGNWLGYINKDATKLV